MKNSDAETTTTGLNCLSIADKEGMGVLQTDTGGVGSKQRIQGPNKLRYHGTPKQFTGCVDKELQFFFRLIIGISSVRIYSYFNAK